MSPKLYDWLYPKKYDESVVEICKCWPEDIKSSNQSVVSGLRASLAWCVDRQFEENMPWKSKMT